MTDLHRVTVKVAIYSTDHSSVLVLLYPSQRGNDDKFGLPGGHIDAGEKPDQALARELDEELEISIADVKSTDFFVHRDGKIVLAYVGCAPLGLVMTPSHPEYEHGVWKSRQEFEDIDIDSGYKRFVLHNWPLPQTGKSAV